MRSVVIALAALVCGCGGETVLRIDIPSPGSSPLPVGLRVAVVGGGISAAPRTITPVHFPGVVVIRGLPAGATSVCVEIDGLDDAGQAVVGGSATVAVAAHQTTRVSVPLADTFARCAPPPDDLAAGPVDLAGADLPPPPDGGAALCPAGAIFCDDFETGDTARWTLATTKYDLGSVVVQSSTVAHGLFALHANATGGLSMNNMAELEKDFAPMTPPLALRASIFAPQPLGSFTMVMALFDSTTHGFAIGGDDSSTWVVTEDQAQGGAPDRHSDMVPASAGQWHCVELTIDAAGMVTLFVDSHQLVGPWPRVSAVSYSTFIVGIDRTVLPNTDVFVDDVALGPSRLFCP